MTPLFQMLLGLLFASSALISAELSPDDLIAQLPPGMTKIGPHEGRGNYLEVIYLESKSNEKIAYEQTFKNGNIKLWQRYHNGLQDGDEIGWYENGSKEHLIPYSLGKMNGVCIHWDSSGVEVGRYIMENGTGTKVIHYPNGALRELQDYQNGVMAGSCFEGYPNGRAKSICWYAKGRYCGPSFAYDNDGVISQFGVIDDKGQLNGPVILLEKGRIKQIEYWLAGNKTSKAQYSEATTSRPDLPPVEDNEEMYLKLIRFP